MTQEIIVYAILASTAMFVTYKTIRTYFIKNAKTAGAGGGCASGCSGCAFNKNSSCSK